MTTADATRLAVLIDADNSTASVTTELLEEIAKYGTPTVKRAYGDWTTPNLARWKDELLRHAIQPMQQFAYTRGKTSSTQATWRASSSSPATATSPGWRPGCAKRG